MRWLAFFALAALVRPGITRISPYDPDNALRPDNVTRLHSEGPHPTDVQSTGKLGNKAAAAYFIKEAYAGIHHIASKGGQASGGSFQPGDPRAEKAEHLTGLPIAQNVIVWGGRKDQRFSCASA
ncbi:hypothetical protein BDW69DRAFT_186804 [Aspergillus filifer]